MSGDDTILTMTFRCYDNNGQINQYFTEGAEILGGHGDWYNTVTYESWQYGAANNYSDFKQFIAETIGSMYNDGSGYYTWTYEADSGSADSGSYNNTGAIKVVVTGNNLLAPILLIKDSSGSIYPLSFEMAKY